MPWEAIEEIKVPEEDSPSLDFSFSDYMESWIGRAEYSNLRCVKNEDGGAMLRNADL